MAGMRNGVSRCVNALAQARQTRRALAAVAVAVSLSLGTAVMMRAAAGTPPPQQSGRLTIDQIGDALTSLGKNTVNNNGQVYYSVNSTNPNVPGSSIISLSPNGNFIWMTIDLVTMPDPGRASAPGLFNLLKKNTDIGPLFFSVNGHYLRLSSPIPNHGMNEELVREFLKQLVDTAADSKSLWNGGALGR